MIQHFLIAPPPKQFLLDEKPFFGALSIAPTEKTK
jgi:hypothetical protein